MQERGFDARVDPETGVIVISGDVDDAEAFGRVVLSRVEVPATTTTVDLSGVTFFPSSAIGVLVRARKTAQRCAGIFEVTSDRHSIAYRVLQVSGFPASPAGTTAS